MQSITRNIQLDDGGGSAGNLEPSLPTSEFPAIEFPSTGPATNGNLGKEILAESRFLPPADSTEKITLSQSVSTVSQSVSTIPEERSKVPAEWSKIKDLLGGRPVAIIDDWAPDLDRARTQLEPLQTTCGSRLFTFRDPLQALDSVVNRGQSKDPFGLIVCDLAMVQYRADGTSSGINGDQLVRDLAHRFSAKNIPLPPVVFYSASHADSLQNSVYSKMERCRHDCVPEDNSTQNFPLTLVDKSSPLPERRLIKGISYVLGCHANCDAAAYEEFASSLQIKVVEGSLNETHLQNCVRLLRLLGECTDALLSEIVKSSSPPPVWEKLQERLGYFTSRALEEYTFDSIVGTDAESALRRHRVPTILAGAVGSISNVMDLEDYWQDPPVTRERVQRVAIELESFNKLYSLSRATTKIGIVAPYDLGQQISEVIELHPDSDRVAFSRPSNTFTSVQSPSLVRAIIEQPIFNALAFGTQVEVTIETITLAEVSEFVREQVTQLAKFSPAVGNESSEPNTLIKITVRDNGPGIPADVLPHIFKPGFSTRGSTGEGLAFVANHLPSVGGAYEVVSKEGQGTDFSLYFVTHSSKLESL